MKSHQFLYIFLLSFTLMSCDDETSEFGLSSTFVKFYGDANTNTGVKVVNTSDGGYFIAGYTNFDDGKIASTVVKANAEGNEEWSTILDTANLNTVKDVLLNDDGTYVLLVDQFEQVGNSITGADIMVKTLAEDGTILTTHLFDSDNLGTYNDFGNGIIKTNDGGYLVIGTTNNTSGGDTDMYVLRLDASFNLIWDKIYGNVNGLNDAGGSVMEDANGDLIWLGIEQVSTTNSRARMVKTNSLGNILWDFNYPLVENNTIVSGTSTVGDFINVNGNYLFTGSHSRRGITLVNVDSDGQEIWFKQFQENTSNSGDKGNDIVLGSDNTLVIAGHSGGTNNDMFLVKTDIQGELIWQNTFGDAGFDEAQAITVTPDGGLVFVGSTFFEETQMIALTKTNQDGKTSD